MCQVILSDRKRVTFARYPAQPLVSLLVLSSCDYTEWCSICADILMTKVNNNLASGVQCMIEIAEIQPRTRSRYEKNLRVFGWR